MVTLAGTQNFNEFELHLRAILSLHFRNYIRKSGASAVILASENSTNPTYSGIENIASYQNGFQNLWQTNFKTVEEWLWL
jgi:phosphoribosylglycinamide formyltransferase 2